MAASLAHPNILAIHDFGADQGITYVVMELLRGRTLREVLEDGQVPAATALRYGVEMALALTAAHECGVCHRDLKPENVFITDDGRVKIVDFGLAFVRRAEDVDAAVAPTTMGTLPGVVLGTPGYLAPEQLQGAADHRSDLFAVGVVLFELLSGHRAFAGPTVIDSLYATLHVDPPFDLMTDGACRPMSSRSSGCASPSGRKIAIRARRRWAARCRRRLTALRHTSPRVLRARPKRRPVTRLPCCRFGI